MLHVAFLTQADFSSNCPAWCLHWHYRKRNLLRELLSHKADILCLQEVQSDHYLDFWAPELQRAGWVWGLAVRHPGCSRGSQEGPPSTQLALM